MKGPSTFEACSISKAEINHRPSFKQVDGPDFVDAAAARHGARGIHRGQTLPKLTEDDQETPTFATLTRQLHHAAVAISSPHSTTKTVTTRETAQVTFLQRPSSGSMMQRSIPARAPPQAVRATRHFVFTSLVQYSEESLKDLIAQVDSSSTSSVPSLAGWIDSSPPTTTSDGSPPETSSLPLPISIPPNPSTTSSLSTTASETFISSYSSDVSQGLPPASSSQSIFTELTVQPSITATAPPPPASDSTTSLLTSVYMTSTTSDWGITSAISSFTESTSAIPTSVDSSLTVPSIDLPSIISTITSVSGTSFSSVVSTRSITKSSSITIIHPTEAPSVSMTSHSSLSFTSSRMMTSTRPITIHTSSTTTQHDNGMTTSTSLGPGILSTNGPRPNSFARNTEAIVGVAVAGFCAIIITVVAMFYACKRYKRKTPFTGLRNASGMHFTSWHPPLAGDDDPYYGRHQNGSFRHLSSASHTNEMAHSNEQVHSATELLVTELRRSVSSESDISHVPRNTSFSHRSFSTHDHADTTFTYIRNSYVPPMPPPSSWSATVDSHHEGYRQNNNAGSSMPSLNAGSSNGHLYLGSSSHGHIHPGSSSHGHIYPSISSHGHTYPGSSSHEHASAFTTSEHQLLASHTSSQRPPTSFKNFTGILDPRRGSLPDIVVSNISLKSSSRESMHPITPKKQAPPPLRFNTLSLKRFSKPKLEPLESSGSWPTPPPPLRVPSPTATETSGMLEDLLTPQLGTRVASSEYSSSASLRDHVDYSRPISGAIRNRVHSTMTFSTDTCTVVDERESNA